MALNHRRWESPPPERPIGALERILKADYYGVPAAGVINLNKACLPAAEAEVIKELKAQCGVGLDVLRTAEETRILAARMLGARGPHEVFFGANTTDVASLFYYLAGDHRKAHRRLLITDGENPSIYRAAQINGDNRNADRSDPLTTFCAETPIRNLSGPIQRIRYRLADTDILGVCADVSDQAIRAQLEGLMAQNCPTSFIISHVLRHNGRILPVKRIIEIAKEVRERLHPEADEEMFICVDGAMAFGNLPTLNLRELGCHLYVASPHKAMGSIPIGVAWMDTESDLVRRGIEKLKHLHVEQRPIMPGAFAPELGIPCNVEDPLTLESLVGFSETANWLKENGWLQIANGGADFTKMHLQRLKMRQYAEKQLGEFGPEKGLGIEFSTSSDGSSFILSFNLFGNMNNYEGQYEPGSIDPDEFESEPCRERRIAERLREKGVALSFIRRNRLFRISFHYSTTEADIDTFIRALGEAIDEIPK